MAIAFAQTRISASENADLLEGTGGIDNIEGLGGDDTIRGFDGDDRLYGDNGHDILFAGNGNDLIVDEYGANLMGGGAGDDDITGGNDNDQLFGAAGDDILRGGAGNDILGGKDGDDVLLGNEGDDRLYGGSGKNRLEGGAGNDTVFASDYSLVIGDEGTDTAIVTIGTDPANKILLDNVEYISFELPANLASAAGEIFIEDAAGADVDLSVFYNMKALYIPYDSGISSLDIEGAGIRIFFDNQLLPGHDRAVEITIEPGM